jgi:hypothetical protein
MLVVALVVTFGTASVIQGVAVARTTDGVSSETFEVTEAVKPTAKPAINKERVTSQFRDRLLHSAASVSGL